MSEESTVSTSTESTSEFSLKNIADKLDEISASSNAINQMVKGINEKLSRFNRGLIGLVERMHNLESQMEYVLERLDPPESSQDSGSESLNESLEPEPSP